MSLSDTTDFIGLNVYYGMLASYKFNQSDDSDSGPSFAPGKLGLELIPFVSTKSDIKGDISMLYSEVIWRTRFYHCIKSNDDLLKNNP